MSGDVNNVAVWAGADVLLGDLAATNPTAGAAFTLNDPTATPAVTTEWDFAGILDGSAGFTEAQSNDSTDFTGWGHGVVATARKNLAITFAFTAIEDNLVTLGLRYDTSGITVAGGGYSGDLAGRDLQRKFKIARQVQTGSLIKRQISKNYAQIETIGDATESDSGLAVCQVTVKIYPTSDATYWATYKGAAA